MCNVIIHNYVTVSFNSVIIEYLVIDILLVGKGTFRTTDLQGTNRLRSEDLQM